MRTKSGEANDKLLTTAELELMQILWKLSEGTVAEVIEAMEIHQKPAYTTVSTLLRILEQKGILKARKEGRGHIYIPLLSKAEYEAKAVRQVVENVFEGTPVSLVKQLLNSGELNAKEIEEIRKLLDQKRASK
jgi:predicted transcriptional regulator